MRYRAYSSSHLAATRLLIGCGFLPPSWGKVRMRGCAVQMLPVAPSPSPLPRGTYYTTVWETCERRSFFSPSPGGRELEGRG